MNERPLVACLTNTVAAHFTANCLLAIGAKPAMVEEPSEAEELAAIADALLINLGTVTERQAEAMRRAIRAANQGDRPWVLDPVGVQLLSFRHKLATEFITLEPSIIRGNSEEIATLMGTGPAGNTGTDPAGTIGTVLLATGARDRIIDNSGVLTVAGGVPLLQAVTATGCAQGGICAAFLGRGQTPREACLSAAKLMKKAGELAGTRAKTPGSFKVALVDALWELSHD